MNKRDVFRLLYRGRFIIIAAGIICAVLAVCLCIILKNTAVISYPPLPETTGEYILDVEALDEYAKARPDEAFINVRKYQIATAYADILNNRVAKDMDSLIKTYETRAKKARAEDESLRALAWQALNSAEVGAEADYVERMDDYVGKSLLAAEKIIEAEYCENIIFLMTKESVIPEAGAEEKVRTDIESIKSAIEGIRNSSSEPLPVTHEMAALTAFFAGMLLCAAVILLVGHLQMTRRLRKQKRDTKDSAYMKIMDEINFRG